MDLILQRGSTPLPRTFPQVAGALIPDNTQHSWRDDVGRRSENEVTDMALVGGCDGRNFGNGRQLSYAGPQALKDITARSRRTVIGGRHSSNGAAPNRGPVSMMHGRLIQRCWPTTRRIFATKLGAVTSPSAPLKIGYPALTGPWRRFAVISVWSYQARARRWVCSALGFDIQCRRVKTANRLSR